MIFIKHLAYNAQSCLTLCNLTDCSPPGFFVHGNLKARILEWTAIPFSRDLSNPGIEPEFPVFQPDSLPFELQGSSKVRAVGGNDSNNLWQQQHWWKGKGREGETGGKGKYNHKSDILEKGEVEIAINFLKIQNHIKRKGKIEFSVNRGSF